MHERGMPSPPTSWSRRQLLAEPSPQITSPASIVRFAPSGPRVRGCEPGEPRRFSEAVSQIAQPIVLPKAWIARKH
jgi:hypothetical protein